MFKNGKKRKTIGDIEKKNLQNFAIINMERGVFVK